MSEIRDMRRATREAIRAERKRAEADIARIQENNRREIERLKREQDEELARYGSELAELEKRQVRALSEAEARVNERLKAEEKKIQAQMEKTRAEAFAKIQAQKREFEEQLRRMYDEIDRRITALMNKLAEMARNEQEVAREQCEEALGIYEKLCKDPDVCTFQADTMRTILAPLVSACREAYNAGDYTAATGKAMLAVVECKQTQISAAHERRDWDERYQAVRSTLDEILDQLAEMTDEQTTVQMVGLSREGSLKSWDEEDYAQIAAKTEELKHALESIPAGGHAMLTTLESQLHSVLNDHVIENMTRRLLLQITAFLMAGKMLVGVCSTEAEEWTPLEDSLIEEKSQTGITLINDAEEKLKARVDVNPDTLSMGMIRLELRLSIGSTRRDEDLQRMLDEISTELKETFHDTEFGAMTCVEEFGYADEDGLPGKVLEFKPVAGSRSGQIIHPARTSSDHLPERTKQGKNEKTISGLKGETT